MDNTNWTLGDIEDLLKPIFPNVLCGEDNDGQFVIWTGFYKNGKKPPHSKIVISIPKDQLDESTYNMLDERDYNEYVVRAEPRSLEKIEEL